MFLLPQLDVVDILTTQLLFSAVTFEKQKHVPLGKIPEDTLRSMVTILRYKQKKLTGLHARAAHIKLDQLICKLKIAAYEIVLSFCVVNESFLVT